MPEETKSKSELQQELDRALKDTFPASDPIAVGEASASEADRPLHRKPAAIDMQLVEQLARNVGKKHGQ